MTTKIDNGKVKIAVCGKIIEIEVRNGKFVKPKELLQVVGRGSALKPAHEPIYRVRKGLTPIPFSDIVMEIGTILDVISCLMLNAKRAEEFFTSNHQDLNGAMSRFVQWIVEENLGKLNEGLSRKTDMFKSPEMEKTFLNIVRLWNRILEGDLNQPNKYTTETATSKIIELKTLNLSLLTDIYQNIIQVSGSKANGLIAFVSNAGKNSEDEREKLKDILNLSVPEDVILRTGNIAAEELANFVKRNSTIQIQDTSSAGDLVIGNGVGESLNIGIPQYRFGNRYRKSNPLYYTAKAGSKERNFGCENLFWLRGDDGGLKEISKAEYDAAFKENEAHKDDKDYVAIPISQGDIWPTIKPLELMRYLVKLCKMPTGNLILDPFLGSGTTACACVLEGCDFVGIDRDPVAVRIANERIKYWTQHSEDEQKNAQPELPL